jgi:hypothetical protein
VHSEQTAKRFRARCSLPSRCIAEELYEPEHTVMHFQQKCWAVPKFVVSSTGEVYDAKTKGPNRKFRLGPRKVQWGRLALVSLTLQ